VNKAVSTLGGLLVIGVAVVFIVQFQQVSPGAQRGAGTGPTCAIELQGSCISTNDFWASYRLIGGGFDAQYLKSMGLRRIVADGLIERWLLNQDAKRLGVTVLDDELTTELAKGRAYVSLPADKEREMGYYLGLLAPQARRIVWETPFRTLNVKNPKTKSFDLKQYDKTIRTITKLSPTDFREFEREEMIASRMRDLVRARVHVADAEGFEDYTRRKSTVTLSYVKLDRNFYADLFVDQSQKAVDEWAAKNAEEINKLYETRKSQYEGECRVTRHILAKVKEDADDSEKAKAKKRIDKALALVNKGEDFAEVAKRFSEDGSAAKGGELGCVPRKQTVEPFEKALFALEEGKVSAIVTSEFGYHLIKLEKIAKGDAMESVVRGQLARELYTKYAADTKAAEAAKSIQAAVKGGKSLDDAVKAYLDELTALTAKKDEKADGRKADGKKPEEKKPAAPKDGDKKPDGDAKSEDDVVENQTPTAENHPDRPLPQVTTPFNIAGNPLPDATSTVELVKQAFALQKPGDTTNDVVPLRVGYGVVQLKEKAPAKKEEWDKDREETLGAIRKVKQAEAVMLYIQRLRSKLGSDAPIKFNPSVVNEPPDEKGEKTPAGPPDEESDPQ
jgi:peptidyl-prolyl cis-trans isomerase D